MDLRKTRQAIEREHARLAKLSAWYTHHPHVPGPYQRDRVATRIARIERRLVDLDHGEATGPMPADAETHRAVTA